MDTSTEAVVVGLLDVPAAGAATLLGAQEHSGARRHGEQLMPAVLAVCQEAGHRLAELDAVVAGAGPGPFTGLRVGLVSAAGLGDALGVPVHGVCSLDAIAHRAGPGEPLLVVSDARRREVYWATYDRDGVRVAGPSVDTPAALASRVAELGVQRLAGPVAALHGAALGLTEHPFEAAALAPAPEGLIASALDALRSGAVPAPLEPIYLRRPDAVPPGERKRVSASRP